MSSHRFSLSFCCVLFLFVLGACSSTPKKDETETQNSKNTKVSKILEPKVGGPGELVDKYDLNKDKRADLWRISRQAQDPKDPTKKVKFLVRIEIDLNADGKIDIRRYYTAGVKTREEFDLDYDGRFDVINYYVQGWMNKQAYYIRSKTQPDVYKYYELVGKKKKKKLLLVKKERDTNLDGRVDYWEYWENGSLDRIGRDTDYDGNVDVWEKNEASE